MGQGRSWMEWLTEGADLPGETLPGVPVVELAGDCRILIENHGGVTEYGKNQIQVRMRYGCICITGENLRLSRMTREQLIVSGRIGGISIYRGAN